MTTRRLGPGIVLAAVASAVLAAPAAADDPPPSRGLPKQTETGMNPALPPPGAVLDAMPAVRLPPAARAERTADPDPIEVDATGGILPPLADPGLGERPTPREAGDPGETIMRPRGGSATGGKPDVPVER